MYKYGFIGMGNMGTAMMKGAIASFGPQTMLFTEKNKEKMKAASKETGVACCDSNRECAENSKYIILAVKPVIYAQVLDEIKDVISDDKVLVSIAPGLKIDDLKKLSGTDRIVRAMPNTPAMVGEGMTGVSYDEKEFTEEEIKDIKEFFSSFGKVSVVEERLMSAVVCASGSSPAYVYMFAEALADGAVKCGMPRSKAYEFVAQTLLGSAKMILETGEHPGKLKDDVCSPAGTTIAAVEKLEEYGFRNAIMKATDACFDKCEGRK